MVATPVNIEPSLLQVQKAVEAIYQNLLQHELEEHHLTASQAFKDNNFTKVKIMAATNLDDNFLRSLAYLSSALATKQASATPTILAESARAAADFAKERTLYKLGQEISQALS
jgi:Tfp pilus assembly protein PilV